MSATGERGKSLHVDIEELAEGDSLGVTQLREVARNVLDRAVALAELDSERATANVAHGRGIAVLSEGISKGLRTNTRIRSGIAHDRGVSPFDLARTCRRERFDGFLSPELPKVSQRLGSKV